MYGRTDGQIND